MQVVTRIDLGGVNSYLIKGDKGFVLFDTGGHLVRDASFSNRRDLLLSGLRAAGCGETDLRLVVLTHGDNDHAGNAASLRDRFHCEIAMHSGDLSLVESPSLDEWMESFHFASLTNRLVFRLMRGTISKVTQKTLADFRPFSPDLLLDDVPDLSDFGLDTHVLHLPGHTRGSIAILTSAGELIAGDLLANLKNPEPAPNALDFTQLAASIGALNGIPVEIVYPGHGEPFTFEQLKSGRRRG